MRSSNVAIQLLEGEASLATQNHVLGELQLEGLTADSAVDITLDIDANGILRVKAVGLSSGTSADLVVAQDDRHRWSNTDRAHDRASRAKQLGDVKAQGVSASSYLPILRRLYPLGQPRLADSFHHGQEQAVQSVHTFARRPA